MSESPFIGFGTSGAPRCMHLDATGTGVASFYFNLLLYAPLVADKVRGDMKLRGTSGAAGGRIVEEDHLMTTEPWVSVDDIATHLGVAKDSAYRWIENKGIPVHKMGRLWKLKVTEVDEWVRVGGSGTDHSTAVKAALDDLLSAPTSSGSGKRGARSRRGAA